MKKTAGINKQFWMQCRRALWLLLVPVLLGASAPSEYEVKLVYIYNFTKFVSWPDSAFPTDDSPLNICVIGNLGDPELAGLLKGKTARNRPISLKFIEHLPDKESCHILFITRSVDRERAQKLVESIKTPTLLVGESTDFAKHAGMIGFVTDDRRRVRIEINLDNARQQQLNIRAQLLEIARVIYRNGERS